MLGNGMSKDDGVRAKQGRSITVTLSSVQPTLQFCDGAKDPYRLLHQGLCAVVRVAQCDDPRWALLAGQWLVEYASEQLRLREERKAAQQQRSLPAVAGNERERLLGELRGLYAKALGQSPLVVQAEPVEAQSEPIGRDSRD